MTPIPFDEHDRVLAERYHQSWQQKYTDSDILDLCQANSARLFSPDRSGDLELVELLIERLNQKEPSSLIRVGDGEGNALQFAETPDDPLAWKCFQHAFAIGDLLPLSRLEGRDFAARVRDAILDADLVGIRSIESEQEAARIALQYNVRAALGIMAARTFMQNAITQGIYRERCILSAWTYIGLLPHLERLLAAAQKVIVITGRGQLAPEFKRRLGSRLLAFRQIPLEARCRESTESHFRHHFDLELKFLKRDLAGVLVLVGGGYFGKIYCHHAKAHGAVAIDLGSGFDILAGVKTRPVHRRIDLDSSRWL